MSNKSQRLRITESGWNGYTGHFGGIEFKDGISTEIVDHAQATRLGSIIGIMLVDTNEQAGTAAELQRTHGDRAPVVDELPRGIVAPKEAPQIAKPAPTHSRESLEAVADANGIAGLRAIAEPLGVRGRGIIELIDGILEAQTA